MRVWPSGRAVRRASRRAATLLLIVLALVPLGGCGLLRTTLGAHDVGPGGIARPQFRLREALVRGDFPAALAWREEDQLLRVLTRATSAYYASQFARAGAMLDTAALMADDRVTKSLSREGLALLTNDNARLYQPRRTERLFIAYYGMLSYVRLDDWEGAAVEARRIAALLSQYEAGRDREEVALHAAMEHLAGAVFERAGRTEEARVAYRAANAMHQAVPELRAFGADQGEVLVVLERGFVAHRVTEQVSFFVGGEEHEGRHGRRGRRADRDSSPDELTRVIERATRGPGRVGSRPPMLPDPRKGDSDGRDDDGHAHRGDDDHDDGGYWLALAVPALRRTARAWGGDASIRAVSSIGEAITLAAVVDDAAAADERRERVAMMARLAARAAARYAVTKAVKDNKGETAGRLVNFGASLLERADIRSWHLLPQEVQLLRLRLPAGAHSVQVEVRDGAHTRLVDVGPVTVRAGTVSIAPVRLWRDPLPAPSVAVR